MAWHMNINLDCRQKNNSIHAAVTIHYQHATDTHRKKHTQENSIYCLALHGKMWGYKKWWHFLTHSANRLRFVSLFYGAVKTNSTIQTSRCRCCFYSVCCCRSICSIEKFHLTFCIINANGRDSLTTFSVGLCMWTDWLSNDCVCNHLLIFTKFCFACHS